MRYLSVAFCIVLLLTISGCTTNGKDVGEEKNVSSEDQNVSENNSSQVTDLTKTTNQINIEDMNFNGVRFGDTRQEVINKLGEPEGIGELYNEYYYANFDISFTDQDQVCLINLYENFSCYKDIKLGDDILTTLKKLPIPTTPSGIDTIYEDFNGEYTHDFTLLDDYLMNNTMHPQMPDQVNNTWRNLEFNFDKYVLSIRFVSPIRAENNKELKAGSISGIQVKTADAPLFED